MKRYYDISKHSKRTPHISKFLFEISMIFETRGSIRKYWLTEDGIVWWIQSLYHTTLDKPLMSETNIVHAILSLSAHQCLRVFLSLLALVKQVILIIMEKKLNIIEAQASETTY